MNWLLLLILQGDSKRFRKNEITNQVSINKKKNYMGTLNRNSDIKEKYIQVISLKAEPGFSFRNFIESGTL